MALSQAGPASGTFCHSTVLITLLAVKVPDIFFILHLLVYSLPHETRFPVPPTVLFAQHLHRVETR